MSEPFDPITTRALDAFTVPPLADGFAERMMARIAASPALPELPPLASPRRDARGGWRRSGIILASVAAFSLVSAAAAATGIFGTNIRATVRAAPVLGTIIASVAPERPKPIAVHKVKPVRVVAPVATTAPIIAPPVIAPVETILPPPADLRSERIAQRIANRLERRADRRAEMGLPPRPLPRGTMAQKLRQLPPEERAAIRQRVHEIRAERRGDLGGIPSLKQIERQHDRAQFRKQRRERMQEIPLPDAADNPERAEKWQALRDMRERRRARRELRRLGQN